MESFDEYIKTDFIGLEPREILKQEVIVLLGVSDNAKQVLQGLSILNVFDLASSRYFNNALRILRSANSNNTSFSRLGLIPADVIDQGHINANLSELFKKDIQLLNGIEAQSADQIKQILKVETIRDFALWPPFTAASRILQHVINPDMLVTYDPESPADLIPSSGDFPTEKAFYSVIVLDEINRDDGQQLEEIDEPVDITKTKRGISGFKKPAFGAIITYEQSWLAQGVTLGNLLHSLALAPGESTRIAMINWARLDSSSLTEEISHSEQLSNVTNQARSISEVTKAVATEAQDGFSRATNNNYATSWSRQKVKSGTTGFGFAFWDTADTSTEATTSSAAYTSSDAVSVSASSGRRDLAASMSQNINNSTQQFANALRSQRASIIAETIQSEDETLATRMITNYNHMHALSIQYYEVVQAFRVITSVNSVDKLIFIPMKVIDNWTNELIPLFRNVLIRNALDDDFRLALLGKPGHIWIKPRIPIEDINALNISRINLLRERNALRKLDIRLGYVAQNDLIDSVYLDKRDEQIIGIEFASKQYTHLVHATIVFNDGTSQRTKGYREGGRPNVFFNQSNPLSYISEINATFSELPDDLGQLWFELLGPTDPDNALPWSYAIPIYTKVTDQNRTIETDGKVTVHLMDVIEIWGDNEHINHLNQNSYYYSRTIWANMNNEQRVFLLSSTTT